MTEADTTMLSESTDTDRPSETPSGRAESQPSDYGVVRPMDSTAERGIAQQIDFLNAIVVLLFGVGLFLGVSSVLLSVQAQGSAAPELGAERTADRIATDLFVDNTSATLANGSCVEPYLQAQNSPECGFDFDTSTENRYLRTSTGLHPDYNMNVTVRNNGDIIENNGTRYALGEDSTVKTDTTTYHRRIAFQNESRYPDYYTVRIVVWKAGGS